MEIQTTAAYTESHVRLALGKDFTAEQLEPDLLLGGELKLLTAEARQLIAATNGYDECVWSGHYYEDDGTVEVTLRKELRGEAASRRVKGLASKIGAERQTAIKESAVSASGTSGCVEPYLSQMLTQLCAQTQENTEDSDALAKLDVLLFLHKLHQRETQVTQAQHTRQLIELARLMETDYLEFRVASLHENTVHVTVFDAVRCDYVAELVFRHYHSSYLLEDCKFS